MLAQVVSYRLLSSKTITKKPVFVDSEIVVKLSPNGSR